MAQAAATEQQQQQQQAPSAVTFVRKHLLDVPPYTPIEPFEVLSARYGRTPQEIVKLDANENPYGPPPEVRKALADMQWPHIYPDPETRQLRKALSELSGVPEEYLLVGASRPRLAWRWVGGCRRSWPRQS
jgi:histidinol-phosphate aminotransferase